MVEVTENGTFLSFRARQGRPSCQLRVVPGLPLGLKAGRRLQQQQWTVRRSALWFEGVLPDGQG